MQSEEIYRASCSDRPDMWSFVLEPCSNSKCGQNAGSQLLSSMRFFFNLFFEFTCGYADVIVCFIGILLNSVTVVSELCSLT